MSSFFNSIFKANPCVCLHLSVSISPHLAVLKEFWNLITLFCTRAIWKFSNSMDYSWGNANLFKPKLFVKMQLQPSLSAQTYLTWERAHGKRPTLFSQLLHKQFVLRLGCGGIWFSLLRQSKGWGGPTFRPSPGPLSYQLCPGRGSNTSHFTPSPAPTFFPHASYQRGFAFISLQPSESPKPLFSFHWEVKLKHILMTCRLWPLASHRASGTASPNLLCIQLLSCPAIEFLSIQAQAKACK